MHLQSSPALIRALQSTLTQLEQTEEIGPEDPALVEIKRSVVRVMAELEIKKASAAEQSFPALIRALQSTLSQLEQTEEIGPEDPALLELKGSIVRVMAELEIKKASIAEIEPDGTALPA